MNMQPNLDINILSHHPCTAAGSCNKEDEVQQVQGVLRRAQGAM